MSGLVGGALAGLGTVPMLPVSASLLVAVCAVIWTFTSRRDEFETLGGWLISTVLIVAIWIAWALLK